LSGRRRALFRWSCWPRYTARWVSNAATISQSHGLVRCLRLTAVQTKYQRESTVSYEYIVISPSSRFDHWAKVREQSLLWATATAQYRAMETLCKELRETREDMKKACEDIQEALGYEQRLGHELWLVYEQRFEQRHLSMEIQKIRMKAKFGGAILSANFAHMEELKRQNEVSFARWRRRFKLLEPRELFQLDAGPTNAQTDSLRLDAGRRRAIFKHTQTRFKSPDVFMEPNINGHLQDTDVSAFPDTGAAANFISLPYAQKHALTIDKRFRKRVKVGNGTAVRVIGTTTLPFSFAGETTKYSLTFHVLPGSFHDVILGSTFLRLSETFTRFAHRVGRKIRESVGRGVRRLCFLGSQQYVTGTANGVDVDAVPDTGSDVSVMSAKFAIAHGFEIDDDERHRISLGFADGSTARTRGVVRNVEWRFGGDDQIHLTDVYVLSGLPVDLVLGYDFLFHTEAFSEHEQDFWHVGVLEQEDFWMLLLIRVLKRAMKDAGAGDSCECRHCIASV
jgi:hypothetical protein